MKSIDSIAENSQSSSTEQTTIDNILKQKRYFSLQSIELKQFSNQLKALVKKGELIEKLIDNGVIYINGFDHLSISQRETMTFEELNNGFQAIFDDADILFYMSDQLQLGKPDEFKAICSELFQEKQAKDLKIIVIDFTYCQQFLIDFSIIRLKKKLWKPVQPDNLITHRKKM